MYRSFFIIGLLLLILSVSQVSAKNMFKASDMLGLKEVVDVKLSPDGQWIAYTLNVPRTASDEPGSAYRELHLVNTETKKSYPYITGKIRVRSIAWNPDGSAIGFLSKREENTSTQVWMIPLKGGEASQLTHSPTSVQSFKWHPDGKHIAYIAETPETAREKALDDMGYGFIYFEENLKHRNLYLLNIDSNNQEKAAKQLTSGITVWSFIFAPDGQKIALAATEKNLVDYQYMFSRVHSLDTTTGEIKQITNNPGKLGNYIFNSKGTHLAYTAAKELKDHAVSQVYVKDLTSGEVKNLTVPDFRGHVEWVNWIDDDELIYYAGEGTQTTISRISVDAESGSERKLVLSSANTAGVVFNKPSGVDEFRQFAVTGHSADFPEEVFHWKKGKFTKLTDHNPQLAGFRMGKQEVITYEARDGAKIEGILIKPVDYEKGKTYPLVVIVHGGPESHYSNGWMSAYSRPGQVFSNQGYLTFYPNYRSSTGYGLEFALTGYGDAAGVEFDDIADAIDHFVETGMADEDRVGVTGGSYGGFASAWFSSYYTEKVKAVGMFVGISNLISKRGTTNIPYEELYVHSGKKLEEMWQRSLERSPLYYANQSKTAVLIYGGTDDDRVHPAQSLEYFRRLKMNDHPAVRLVQYPGEKHGNAEQPGRIDVCYRLIDWFNWYVRDDKPLDGPMPPLDIADKYGIDLPAVSD